MITEEKMKIDFAKIEEKCVENFKNGQGKVYLKVHKDEEENVILIRIPKGSSIGRHTHLTDSETEFVLQGKVVFTIDGKEETVEKGQCHFCRNGSSHAVRNDGDEDAVIFAVVPLLKR